MNFTYFNVAIRLKDSQNSQTELRNNYLHTKIKSTQGSHAEAKFKKKVYLISNLCGLLKIFELYYIKLVKERFGSEGYENFRGRYFIVCCAARSENNILIMNI